MTKCWLWLSFCRLFNVFAGWFFIEITVNEKWMPNWHFHHVILASFLVWVIVFLSGLNPFWLFLLVQRFSSVACMCSNSRCSFAGNPLKTFGYININISDDNLKKCKSTYSCCVNSTASCVLFRCLFRLCAVQLSCHTIRTVHLNMWRSVIQLWFLNKTEDNTVIILPRSEAVGLIAINI